jgi:hypothetical protein
MTDLIYPTLDLFLYYTNYKNYCYNYEINLELCRGDPPVVAPRHYCCITFCKWYYLRNGLGDSEAEISDRRQQFLKKIPESTHQTICNNDNDFETEYTELLPKAKVQKFENIREANSLAGYYYPVRIGDTYGLLVDCSVENQTSPQPAECFKELKQEIEQNQLKGELANIGQTWMISGWMPQGTEKSPEEIATACYKSLIPEGNWEQDIDGKGKFLGADIFELSRYRLVIKQGQSVASSIQDVQNSWHIIIIIYPNKETAEKAANFYFEWLPLFIATKFSGVMGRVG